MIDIQLHLTWAELMMFVALCALALGFADALFDWLFRKLK